MNDRKRPLTILMADDDADDRQLAEEALREARFANDLKFVRDGRDLLDYLTRTNGYTKENAPKPGLILLDLNMPRMDGREALTAIKAEPDLQSIPVVVLTTSKADEDIVQSYELGAASYIPKPVTFMGLVDAMKILGRYWFELVAVPDQDSR
ncbi:MAG: response regulator [Acidimicrobiia bacterium]|nr:response regulator [Acidimicrobiia bacterium]